MQLNVSGHHVEVTNSLKIYLSTKVKRLERHFDRITSMNVILSVEKRRQKAESTIHISGCEIYAASEHKNLYAAIDQLADKLDRQLIKKKEKTKIKLVKFVTSQITVERAHVLKRSINWFLMQLVMNIKMQANTF